MNMIESKDTDFLFDVNDPQLNALLKKSLEENPISVVATTGKVDDLALISKIYNVGQKIRDKNNCKVRECYHDDGLDFVASVSFIKKPKEF